jgi:hypothetical protein
MMKRTEILKKFLIILCGLILIIIPLASVFDIKDQGLLNSIGMFQRIAGFMIVSFTAVKMLDHISVKPLTQEMEEEEIKEADQKDRKQLLFKPTIGFLIFFLFLILLGISGFIHVIFLLEPNEDGFLWVIGSLFLIVLSFFLWYLVPVFIFTEDLVQIKPFLYYNFGIDRKTIIRYADITSVSPDAELGPDRFRYGSRYRIVISMNGTRQKYGLTAYNSDIIAKIYLRFREKLGDKVKSE